VREVNQTWRLPSSELGGCRGATVEMHFEAVIEQVWRKTSRPRLSKCGDRNHASLKMHLVTIMVRPWRR
jgi:hypothetical protein